MTGSVDTETLNMLKEVMEDDFNALISTYLDDAGTRIPQLQTLLEEANAEELRHCAHSLKGSSSNLGAMPLSELCFEVETRAKEQQLGEVEPFLRQIEQEYEQVKTILSGML